MLTFRAVLLVLLLQTCRHSLLVCGYSKKNSLLSTETDEMISSDYTTITDYDSFSSTMVTDFSSSLSFTEMTEDLSSSWSTIEITDEPTSTPSTSPPTCDCDSMQIEVGDVEVGTNWFTVPFNSTTSDIGCILRDLTALNVSLNGPFDDNGGFKVQNCTALPVCLHGKDNSFIFNSTLCCPTDIAVQQCSNYTLVMIPQYSLSCYGNSVSEPILTLPGPNAHPSQVEARKKGSDWVELVWEDNYCSGTITSYFMAFQSITSNQLNEVPIECTAKEKQLTVFDSKKCPDLFLFESCTVYNFTIVAVSFGRYNSSASSINEFNTEPPESMIMNLNHQLEESGSDWLVVRWNLSVQKCQSAAHSFNLELKNVQNGTIQTFNCTSNSDQSTDINQYVYNTSSKDCGAPVLLSPCSDYIFVITPQIFNNIYPTYQNKTTGRTIPGADTTALIRSTNSGSEWISFNWTSSIEECRWAVTGFWFNINQAEALVPDNQFQFINMTNCYGNWDKNEEIMFNTSSTCPSQWNSTEILTCTDYQVNVIPQFFDIYNGSVSTVNVSSTPGGDITANILAIEAGKSWISFVWQASDQRCEKVITGLWVTMKSSPFRPGENISQLNNYSCPLTLSNDSSHIFNTSLSCFPEKPLFPCRSYYFMVVLDLNKNQLGLPNYADRMTTPGNDSYALVSTTQAGVDWISFRWQSSVPDCQKFISGYQLNLTMKHNGSSQSKYLSKDCSEKPPYKEIVFNSSLPCANFRISPCTNFVVSIIPEYSINNGTILGLSKSTEIESESGGNNEIRELSIPYQDTNSVTLKWKEPICQSSGNLQYYNVSIKRDWIAGPKLSSADETFLTIKRSCLKEELDGSVSVTLKETICNSTQGFKFETCSPYVINVLPSYQLASANNNVTGWTTSAQTLPLSPAEVSVNDLTVQSFGGRWISIMWPIPSCRIPVSQWNLTEISSGSKTMMAIPPECPGNANSSHFQLNITENSVVCRNSFINSTLSPIRPCSNYHLRLSVTYRNLDEVVGNFSEISTRTEKEPPSQVDSLRWIGKNTSVSLQWNQPNQNPQCVESYRVKWINHETSTNETNITLDGFDPCFKFPVSVQPLPENPTESPVTVEVSTSTSDPAPIDSDILVQATDELMRNLSWLKPDYDACISGYQVNILEQGHEKLIFNQTLKGKSSTALLLREGEPFERDKTYNILVSSYSDFNATDSSSLPKSHLFTWSMASGMINTTGVICGTIFGILALVIIYLFFLIRRSEGADVLTPVILLEELKQVTMKQATNSLNDKKPIPIDELALELSLLEADSSYQLSKEFDQIKFMSSSPSAVTFNAAELPENRAKNRYTNILPYDHNRVKIKTGIGEPPFSDYINASFVSGYTDNQFYIAAQGPKPLTVEEFWLMCYEQDVKLIMALTALEEKGRVKCAQYWPIRNSANNPIEYGNVHVELVDEVQQETCVLRDFFITKISRNSSFRSSKFVRQIHFTQWPDFGCPENPETLIQLVHAMRAEHESLCNTHRIVSPIVVHCSAGVGRTGTLIALDILMEQARRTKVIDVVRTVLKLRKDRVLMVQSEEQYRFLYKCIYTYVRNELKVQVREDGYDKSALIKSTDFPSSERLILTPLTLYEKNPNPIEV